MDAIPQPRIVFCQRCPYRAILHAWPSCFTHGGITGKVMLMSTIQVQHLGKSFDGLAAVRDISFTVNSGELVGLLGPNGAGKSTTMRMLAGFLPQTSGTIEIAGFCMTKSPRAGQARLGYLPEVEGLFGHLTAYEYLLFLARSYSVAQPPEAIRIATEMIRCHDFLHRPMVNLSKGQRQRVLFAGALLHDPDVLILDEPTDGLDPNQKHEMRLVLRELAKYKAVLVSTHILEEAEAICTRCMIMSAGRIVADMTPEKLKSHGNGDIQRAFRVLTTQGRLAPQAVSGTST